MSKKFNWKDAVDWIEFVGPNCPIEITQECPIEKHPNELMVICRKGQHIWLYLGTPEENS